jgi:NAD-dependent dihydropyrimidine dehydrogenase PreA subunit
MRNESQHGHSMYFFLCFVPPPNHHEHQTALQDMRYPVFNTSQPRFLVRGKRGQGKRGHKENGDRPRFLRFSWGRCGACVRSAGIPARSPASGLLRRAAPAGRQGPFAGGVPWALCVLCALCGESLHSLRAAPFSWGRCGAACVRSAGIPARSPASGLLRRAALAGRQGPFAGGVPWALCVLCVSAVNPCIL